MIDPKTLTVLVTGASSGFGEATARRFVKEGSRVIAAARRGERLKRLAAELGGRCQAVPLDVRDKAAVDALAASLPSVDVVVANAGLALGLEPAHETDPEDWERMVDTNIKGLLYTVRAFLPGMAARRRGHVILMGSIAGDYPYPGGNVYGATKAFVLQFALNLRADLLARNIRVTNIEPGLAETEFSLVRFHGDAKKAAGPYQGLKPLVGEDIAEAVFWAATLPEHVNVNRIQLMPTAQGFGPFAVHRA
ncbi:MAG: SDR family NAD(P)-dependent oxidoreductase [Elusimicrobiota bacterium]